MSRTFFAACLLVCTSLCLRAGEAGDGKATTTSTAEEETTEYKNWIELGIGGVITSGDRAQFEQEHHLPGDEVYGGIQDLHLEQSVGKNATLTLDGHALWDINDYDVKLQLVDPKVGYIKAGFTEFRTWYDGNAGFFPHNGAWFRPPFPEMHIDRGDAWIELGLRLPDWPEITIRYSHEFRDGMKDSTIWGDTNQTGLSINPTRRIVPAFRDIDETRDIVSLEATKTFGNTDVTLGMRYEHADNDDTLNVVRGAGQVPPVVPPPGALRFLTQHDNSDLDLFSGHAISETRLTNSLWFTAGYSYTTMNSDLSGSRIIGPHFDSAIGEPIPTLQPFDHQFLNLAGTAQRDEHLFNANLFWMPFKDVAILSGFRYTHIAEDADSMFLDAEVGPVDFSNFFGPQKRLPPVPTFAETSNDYDRFGERLEARYTGVKNWVFWIEGDWEEEYGKVRAEEEGGIEEEPLDKDTTLVQQKYTIGANWYPAARVNLSAQYYHKIDNFNEDIKSGEFQRLRDQDWNVDDANIRITYRPKIPTCLGMLAIVTRYDFVRTEIDGAFFHEGDLFAEQETGVIKKHMITGSVTWNPLNRLYLQTDVSYVLDETDTPASKINLVPFTSPSVLNFRNDYWTLTTGAGYLLDQKTDLHVEYTFYRATDWVNNAAVGLPFGMGASEHTASASVSRELTKQMRLLIKYTYFNYADETFGGHNNYRAHSIYSGLQYRF